MAIMASHIFVALLLTASFVKAGNETNTIAGKETTTKIAEKPKTYLVSKKTIPDCISKSDLFNVYILGSFGNIVSLSPTERSEISNKSPKAGKEIKNEDGISFKFEDIRAMKEFSSELKAQTKLKLDPPVEGVVLVKSTNQRYDDEYLALESEIKFLKQLENLKTSPKYHFCFYESNFVQKDSYFSYHIVQEELGENLASQVAKDKFKGFKLPVKIYKALQIALIVQNMHTLGITHQNINIYNIVPTDEGLREFRLIDFTYAVKVGETGITNVGVSPIGILKVYSPADKYAKTFTATFQQDAFALAVTFLHLFDEKGVFGPKITAACPQNAATLSENCKKAYLDKTLVINDDGNIKKIVLYLQKRLFGEKEELDVGKMIAELVSVYKAIVKEDSTFLKTTEEVHKIDKISKENQTTIGNLVIAPANKELIVL